MRKRATGGDGRSLSVSNPLKLLGFSLRGDWGHALQCLRSKEAVNDRPSASVPSPIIDWHFFSRCILNNRIFCGLFDQRIFCGLFDHRIFCGLFGYRRCSYRTEPDLLDGEAVICGLHLEDLGASDEVG
jgi:hypothetical protein